VHERSTQTESDPYVTATMPPPAAASCQNCLFFRPLEKGSGTCHRYPPSFAGDASPKESHHWRFPLVGSHSWCGEHKVPTAPADPAACSEPGDA
jgi:hypothetical protein